MVGASSTLREIAVAIVVELRSRHTTSWLVDEEEGDPIIISARSNISSIDLKCRLALLYSSSALGHQINGLELLMLMLPPVDTGILFLL